MRVRILNFSKLFTLAKIFLDIIFADLYNNCILEWFQNFLSKQIIVANYVLEYILDTLVFLNAVAVSKAVHCPIIFLFALAMICSRIAPVAFKLSLTHGKLSPGSPCPCSC